MDDNILLAIIVSRYLRKKRRKRRYCIHPVNAPRLTCGQFHTLFVLLRNHEEKFFSYFRMGVSSFDELCSYVKGGLQRQTTRFHNAISVEERLAVTLRFLATGNTFRSLSFEFRLGRSTISVIIWETCREIWTAMKDKFMPEPTTEDWTKIAEDFENRANFPNCLGAIDGKHVRLVKPDHSGSHFFNYKNYCSLVLLGVADANYCFITVDVGAYGKSADSNIFRQSLLNKKLCSGSLNIPDKRPLLNFNSNTPMPFTFVADEAFAMSENVMRPYGRKDLNNKKRIFNYRLSRARRFIECAFGILANKWRIFHTAIHLDPDFVTLIVLATCLLHNFVRLRDGFKFEDTLICEMLDMPIIGTGGTGYSAKQVRDSLAEFFISPAGSLPWQYDMI